MRTKDEFKELYAKRIASIADKVSSSEVYVDMKLREISNAKLDSLREKVRVITNQDKVWNDFTFRTGKLLGMFRQMANNQVKMSEFESLGISKDDIDNYRAYYGNAPYISKKGKIVPAVKPNIPKLKDWITCIYLKLGLFIDDADIEDITQDKFDYLHENAMQYCIDTLAVTDIQEHIAYEE